MPTIADVMAALAGLTCYAAVTTVEDGFHVRRLADGAVRHVHTAGDLPGLAGWVLGKV